MDSFVGSAFLPTTKTNSSPISTLMFSRKAPTGGYSIHLIAYVVLKNVPFTQLYDLGNGAPVVVGSDFLSCNLRNYAVQG